MLIVNKYKYMLILYILYFRNYSPFVIFRIAGTKNTNISLLFANNALVRAQRRDNRSNESVVTSHFLAYFCLDF